MKVVLQRCKTANVKVEGKEVGNIGVGLVLLVGLTHDDTEEACSWIADKIVNLRIFEDSEGKMNRSLMEENGEILSVSQFTLYGDCNKGRRPNFMSAAKPEHAETLYDRFNELLRAKNITVETGIFGAMMDVSLVNAGPVTLILER
ncbi:D-aminoacyl-tRNA deacylase [Bacillus sp. FSL K6-3431]|uniref:D-aminoacyl-tRNA deacylase n=1 Tax=Bacillus sp. FSL K6-3431 TaxID=2921500 RepID=UPI0030FB55A9